MAECPDTEVVCALLHTIAQLRLELSEARERTRVECANDMMEMWGEGRLQELANSWLTGVRTAPIAGQLVEIENEAGVSIGFGRWVGRPGDYWVLRLGSAP